MSSFAATTASTIAVKSAAIIVTLDWDTVQSASKKTPPTTFARCASMRVSNVEPDGGCKLIIAVIKQTSARPHASTNARMS
jgi:hypothetical protein